MDLKCVLLVSGGLDSYIGYHYLKKDGYKVKPLFVNYGGKYSEKEKVVVQKLFPDLIIDNCLNFYGEDSGEKAFIKNRNAYLALVASKYSNAICMAGLKDDNVGDKSPEAFVKMSALLTEINNDTKYGYIVFSPFWRKTKADILHWYLSAGLSVTNLLMTTSCYHPTATYCGECPSCFRRYCAFVSAGVPNFIPMFRNTIMAEEYFNKKDSYDAERSESIKKACAELGIL